MPLRTPLISWGTEGERELERGMERGRNLGVGVFLISL